MEDLIDDIVQKYEYKSIIERFFSLVRKHPQHVQGFIRKALLELPEGNTVINASFSYLPMDDFDDLVELAVNTLKTSPGNRIARTIILRASLQCNEKLQPYLKDIFELSPDKFIEYDRWIWRDAKEKEISFLIGIVQSNDISKESRQKACWCLLHSRKTLALEYLHSILSEVPIIAETLNSEFSFEELLQHVDCHYTRNGIETLYSSTVLHLEFPGEYLERKKSTSSFTRYHPTWRLETPSIGKYHIGGQIKQVCNNCGGKMHQIISFDRIPEDLGVNSSDKIVFATCLSCLGWVNEISYSKHGPNGSTDDITPIFKKTTPEFPADPLASVTVVLKRAPRRWYHQSWWNANDRENLNRFGGPPSWVQDSVYPACQECGQLMKFFGQLDSGLLSEDGYEWLWGSGGVCYIFWCDRCKTSAYHWQCT
ncbi:MAG: hypothetical protein ACFFD4_17840 [Candidatus Odinarchaeota archaeon]